MSQQFLRARALQSAYLVFQLNCQPGTPVLQLHDSPKADKGRASVRSSRCDWLQVVTQLPLMPGQEMQRLSICMVKKMNISRAAVLRAYRDQGLGG